MSYSIIKYINKKQTIKLGVNFKSESRLLGIRGGPLPPVCELLVGRGVFGRDDGRGLDALFPAWDQGGVRVPSYRDIISVNDMR